VPNIKKFHQSSRAGESNLLVFTLSQLSLQISRNTRTLFLFPCDSVRSETLSISTRSRHCPTRSSSCKSQRRPSPSNWCRTSDNIRRDIRIEPTRANRGRIQRGERRSCKKYNLLWIVRFFCIYAMCNTLCKKEKVSGAGVEREKFLGMC